MFDVYEGAGHRPDKKSVAIAVTLQPTEKTLTDAEIEAVSAEDRRRGGEEDGRGVAPVTSPSRGFCESGGILPAWASPKEGYGSAESGRAESTPGAGPGADPGLEKGEEGTP